jgi:hypothetical protein
MVCHRMHDVNSITDCTLCAGWKPALGLGNAHVDRAPSSGQALRWIVSHAQTLIVHAPTATYVCLASCTSSPSTEPQITPVNRAVRLVAGVCNVTYPLTFGCLADKLLHGLGAAHKPTVLYILEATHLAALPTGTSAGRGWAACNPGLLI